MKENNPIKIEFIEKLIKTLFLFLSLCPLVINAQNKLFMDYCKDYDMETEKVINSEGKDLANEFAKVTLKLRDKHKDLEFKVKLNIKEQNPTITEAHLEQEYVKQMTLSVIAYSKNILIFNRKLSGDCPKETKTLMLIRRDIDELLKSNSGLTLLEQKKLADSYYLTSMKRHAEQVNKEYSNGFFDPELVNNLGNYLIHKSDLYCRAYMFEFAYYNMK